MKAFLSVLGGTCFSLGAVLAGADFEGVPWLNVIGVALFCCIVPIGWKLEKMEGGGQK